MLQDSDSEEEKKRNEEPQKKKKIVKKKEEEEDVKYAPHILQANFGMLSYGDESLREEPVFLKMWPKTEITNIKLKIDEMKKRCYLRFDQTGNKGKKNYSILIKFSQILEAYLFEESFQEFLVLKLKRPPRVSKFEKNQVTKKWDYFRTPSFLREQLEFINFYLIRPVVLLKVQFQDQSMRQEFIQKVFQKIRQPALKRPFDPVSPLADQTLKDLTKQQGGKGLIVSHVLSKLSIKNFRLGFAMFSLLSSGIVCPADFDLQLFKKIQEIYNEVDLIVDTIEAMCSVEPLRPGRKVTELFMSLFSSKKEQRKKKAQALKSDFQLIYRISRTPTLIYYFPPTYELGNRVTRLFSQKLEYFLRMTFIDENKKPGFYYSDKERPLAKDINRLLMNKSLNICGRIYKFLASSSSQMKRHSLWMLSEIDTLKFDDVFSKLGDFDVELIANKNLSRRGQSFSTTRAVCRMKQSQIIEEEDIKKGAANFSDGVGRISLELAQKCALTWNYRFMSAFQIRCGGAKGVLTLDLRLPKDERKIVLRNSMIKFKSINPWLEVIRCATYSPGLLNRQIIILLNTLGVPEKIFMNILKREVEGLNHLAFDMKLNENNSELFACLPFFQQQVKRMIEGEKERDPLFTSLLSSFAFNRLVALKEKSKILDRDAARLIGVIDELGVLEENEVFCQICKTNFQVATGIGNLDFKGKDKVQVFEGPCIVSKNPCISTGDVRKLVAVNRPELRHLINVVVFSQKGKMPQFKKMAGGDLDGDVYFISMNKAIIESLEKEDEPAQFYVKGKPAELAHVTLEDLINSFTNYIQEDNLGIIANRYLAIADFSELQARDPKCLKLGGMHAQAVDFAKHGKGVGRSELEDDELKIKKWPHFFQKKYEEMYHSTSVLGKLYDYITLHGEHIVKETGKNILQCTIFERYSLELNYIYRGFMKFIEVAEALYHDYEIKIREMLFDYGLETESQLFALDLTPLEKKRKRGGKDKYDTENELRLKVVELQRETQAWFEDAVLDLMDGDEDVDDGLPRREEENQGSDLERGRLRLASAIYFVTYYSESAKNKDDFLQVARLLSDKDKRLDVFIEKRKKEAVKKEQVQMLFIEEMKQKERVGEEMKEKQEQGQFKRFRRFLEKERRGEERKTLTELSKILSFPWVCCPFYLNKILQQK